MFGIIVEDKKNAIIVKIAGELTLYNMREFDNVFAGYSTSEIRVIALDLGGMVFIDSFGISRIVKISRSFTGKADFILLNVHDDILDVFRMAAFDRIFNIMSEAEFREKYLT
jgi:anti-anti-sigma factor